MFVALRHVGGLRREICVLLTAEVIALTYYRVLALAYEDPVLAAACERIFATSAATSPSIGPRSARVRVDAAGRAYRGGARLAGVRGRDATVVALDHRDVLALAGVSRREFEAEVRDRAARLAHAVRQGPAGERPGFAPL